MEGIKPEVCRQVIADFYQRNVGKQSAKHFKGMGYKKTQVYVVVKQVDTREAVKRKKGQGAPRKLSIAQEWKMKATMNNKNSLFSREMALGANLHIPVIETC